MIVFIDKKVSVRKAKQQINQLQKKKQFDAFGFLGKVKSWGKDGLDYQKKVRDKWQDIS